MTSIGTAVPLTRGSLVRRSDKTTTTTSYPCFHPLPHVGSLPVTARCPSFVEPEFHGRASHSQRRCNAASTASTSTSGSGFGCYQFSSANDALCKLRFGLRSLHGVGGRRHGFRVPRSAEDGGGEKGGGNSTSTATEEPEKDDPNSDDSNASPSTPPPVCLLSTSPFYTQIINLS